MRHPLLQVVVDRLLVQPLLVAALPAQEIQLVVIVVLAVRLVARQILEPAPRVVEPLLILIREEIAAGFYNIDIDTSTIVDLDKPTLAEQQDNIRGCPKVKPTPKPGKTQKP